MFKIKNTIILAVLTSFIHCGRIRVEVLEEPAPQTELTQVTAEETVAQTERIQVKDEGPLPQTGLTQITGEETTPQVKSIEVRKLNGDKIDIKVPADFPFSPQLLDEYSKRIMEQLIIEEYRLFGQNFKLLQGNLAIKPGVELKEDVPITLVISEPRYSMVVTILEMDNLPKREKIREILEKNFPGLPVSFGPIDELKTPILKHVLVSVRTIAEYSYLEAGSSLKREDFIHKYGADETRFTGKYSRSKLYLYINPEGPSDTSEVRLNGPLLERLDMTSITLQRRPLWDLIEEYYSKLCLQAPFAIPLCLDLESLTSLLAGKPPKATVTLAWYKDPSSLPSDSD